MTEAMLASDWECLAEELREYSYTSQGMDYGEAKPWPMEQYAPAFSDLSPEALALILRDCERLKTIYPTWADRVMAGRDFYEERQRGEWVKFGFPPITPYLSDDGKACLR